MSHEGNKVGLFEAHDIIQARVGPGMCSAVTSTMLSHRAISAFGVIFAVALLCAGQTASITATLAGQIVSEGFIEWRVSVSPFR